MEGSAIGSKPAARPQPHGPYRRKHRILSAEPSQRPGVPPPLATQRSRSAQAGRPPLPGKDTPGERPLAQHRLKLTLVSKGVKHVFILHFLFHFTNKTFLSHI